MEAGSEGQVYLLDSNLRRTRAITASVSTDFRSGYSVVVAGSARNIEVEITGHYFDEIAGRFSVDPLTLRVIAPNDQNSNVQANINLLSTLTAARLRVLSGIDPIPNDPFAVAESELNQLFNFAQAAGLPMRFHTLDLTGQTDADAFALLVSLIILEAANIDYAGELAQFVGVLAIDFADNGVVDTPEIRQSLQRGIDTLDLDTASAALENYYSSIGESRAAAPAEKFLNRSPVADAGPDLVGQVGTVFTLEGTGSSDIDGDSLDYRWTIQREQLQSNPFLVLPPPVERTGTFASFTPTVTGTYRVTLTVTDSFGQSDEDVTQLIAHYTFTANGDGTVTNDTTGEMWQRLDDGRLYTLAEAKGTGILTEGDNNGLNVCGDLVRGGYDDWRVPRLWEVETLRDFRFSDPTIDSVVFAHTLSSIYLSDSWRPNSHADYVNFANGQLQHVSVNSRYRLRCIRP
jgi:hypothetical protein